MTNPEEILDFWFGGMPVSAEGARQKQKFWFAGGEEADRLIRERFGADLTRAGEAGEYEQWQETPAGTLALILLLDQFPRNVYRGTPLAYAFDERALLLCLAARERRQDLALGIVERAFFYLPLEHAEALAMQQLSVQAFRVLLEEAPADMGELCQGFLDYALRHRDIIERFGRFPHRNEVLGRPSTLEEIEFLKTPGSSF